MKKLVVSPHCDDEALGCSSVLDEKTFVLYLGVNEWHVVSKEERIKELNAVAKFYGFEYSICKLPVDNYGFQQVLDTIQVYIDFHRPEEIYLPYASYNQDHQVTFKAGFTALRPHDKNFFVKKAFVYEEVHPNLWDENSFKPNYFKEVNILKKVDGYKLYASQVRGHRSPEMVTALARWRGFQSGFRFAEGFEILRWVD